MVALLMTLNLRKSQIFTELYGSALCLLQSGVRRQCHVGWLFGWGRRFRSLNSVCVLIELFSVLPVKCLVHKWSLNFIDENWNTNVDKKIYQVEIRPYSWVVTCKCFYGWCLKCFRMTEKTSSAAFTIAAEFTLFCSRSKCFIELSTLRGPGGRTLTRLEVICF